MKKLKMKEEAVFRSFFLKDKRLSATSTLFSNAVRSRFRLLPLFLLLPLVVNADPRISVSPRQIDFGSVKEGEVVNSIITIKNEGDSPLNISKVQPACGCSTVELAKKSLQAEESTTLNIKLDTTGFKGNTIKKFRIVSDDSVSPSLLLTMKGEVISDVVVEPSRVYFGDVRYGQGKNVTLSVLANDVKDFTILEAVSDTEFVKIEEVSTNTEGKVFRVALLPEAPVGEIRSRVILKTTSKKHPTVIVPVLGKVVSELRLYPSDISFGLLEGPLNKERVETVELVNNSNESIKIESISVENRFISVEYNELVYGKRFNLTVTIDKGAVGIIRSNIVVKTNSKNPSLKRIELPVYATISRK